MNNILIIEDGRSDLGELLKKHCNTTSVSTEESEFPECDALCVLCGNSPLDTSVRLQAYIEKVRLSGKPVFCEQPSSLGMTRARGRISTDKQRLAFYGKHLPIVGLQDGDLLNAQSNLCIKYGPIGEVKKPILTFQEYVCAHYRAELTDDAHTNGIYALWWLDDNTLISSIKLSNFHRARFAPAAKWQLLITEIISYLAGERVDPAFPPPVVSFRETAVSSPSDTDDAVKRGMGWIESAKILVRDGLDGAHEGYTNSISAYTGIQAHAKNVRTDCTCEIGGALLFDSLITGNELSRRRAESLFDFAFEFMQVKSGDHKGMMRWSAGAWETCFQDDVARAILPLLLLQHFGKEVPYFKEIEDALYYMLITTAKNGIRVAATEIYLLTEEMIEKLKNGEPEPSAHFGAYYHAALLLAYRINKKKEYLDCAVRGLSSLMAAYPDTYRETSETEECTRLIFPLAVLFGITGAREHYEWLSRITDELALRRHPSGGYAEWDTGYKAACSRNHKGECALLANNGDPVADLLYSNNWLPLAFAYAYMVTGEERYRELWCSHASFILSAQMHSDRPELNGAWTRAFDMDAKENYGMPHDAGWGPHCIESGWTVAEILMGLQFMKALDLGLLKK